MRILRDGDTVTTALLLALHRRLTPFFASYGTRGVTLHSCFVKMAEQVRATSAAHCILEIALQLAKLTVTFAERESFSEAAWCKRRVRTIDR